MINPICSKCKFLTSEPVRFRKCPRIPIFHRDMLCSNERNMVTDNVTGEKFTPFCEEVNRHAECLVYYPTTLQKPEITFEEGLDAVTIVGTNPLVVTTDGKDPTAEDLKFGSTSLNESEFDEETNTYKIEMKLEHTSNVKAVCIEDGVLSEVAELYCEIEDVPEIEFDKSTNTVTIKSYNKVFFTTDGGNVTEDSEEYKGPFVIDHNTTIKARSFARYELSEQVSKYCVSIEPPVIKFDPDTNKVTITADDRILVSTDGTDIYPDSDIYIEPFEIDSNKLIKAACIVDDELSEQVELQCNVARKPEITYDQKTHKVTIESENEVRYTTDGSDVKQSSLPYIGPFVIMETCTVKAVSFANGKKSEQAELECIFVAPPEITFNTEDNLVTISGENKILYSTDGSKIYDDSDEYTDPFVIEKNTTVKAACILNGVLSDEVVLVCKVPSEPKIAFDSRTKTVTITGENTILYTTDGSDVRKKDSEYKSPFKITETKTIKARTIVDDRLSEQAELVCTV